MMLARRLIEDAPDHKLGTLVRHLKLNKPAHLRAHRALDDVLMTVALWNHLTALLTERIGSRQPDFEVYSTLMKRPKAAAAKYLCQLAAASCQSASAGAGPAGRTGLAGADAKRGPGRPRRTRRPPA